MREQGLNPVLAARLLRELATELVAADGAERNGLFLELHRLQDTLFRLALESHPQASPTLASRAFGLADPLPAPQVVRELQNLHSSWVTPEIRNLYKHMNVARNNMAHASALERVTISRSNSKRMAHLARLLADQLDPAREGLPEARVQGRAPWPAAPGWLLGGGVAGMLLGWAWWEAESTLLVALVGSGWLAMLGAAWWSGRRSSTPKG